jgi:hypothetical protein
MRARASPDFVGTSPLVTNKKVAAALKGRNSISAFQALAARGDRKPGATRSATLRACPWLSYSAPLALCCVIALALCFRNSPAPLALCCVIALRRTARSSHRLQMVFSHPSVRPQNKTFLYSLS